MVELKVGRKRQTQLVGRYKLLKMKIVIGGRKEGGGQGKQDEKKKKD